LQAHVERSQRAPVDRNGQVGRLLASGGTARREGDEDRAASTWGEKAGAGAAQIVELTGVGAGDRRRTKCDGCRSDVVDDDGLFRAPTAPGDVAEVDRAGGDGVRRPHAGPA